MWAREPSSSTAGEERGHLASQALEFDAVRTHRPPSPLSRAFRAPPPPGKGLPHFPSRLQQRSLLLGRARVRPPNGRAGARSPARGAPGAARNARRSDGGAGARCDRPRPGAAPPRAPGPCLQAQPYCLQPPSETAKTNRLAGPPAARGPGGRPGGRRAEWPGRREAPDRIRGRGGGGAGPGEGPICAREGDDLTRTPPPAAAVREDGEDRGGDLRGGLQREGQAQR